MKNKSRKMAVLAVCVVLLGNAFFQEASADESKKGSLQQSFYRQQMILFGLYVYGIEQALAQPVPDVEDLQFLAVSIEEIAKQIKTTKEDQPYHDNMQVLIAQTQALKRARTPEQGRLSGQALLSSCASCHRTQLPVSGH